MRHRTSADETAVVCERKLLKGRASEVRVTPPA